MEQLHAFVSGAVQGVNFRYYAKRHAESLGLKGFVKNLVDGRVEVLAQGSKEQLARMHEWLKHGPNSASVEQVKVEWEKAGEKYKGFRIEF